MAGVTWHYVLKFIITGEWAQPVHPGRYSGLTECLVGDAAVGKSSLLVRLTDQRFLANPDPTVSIECSHVSRSCPLVSDELRSDTARSRVRVKADYYTGGREGGETSMYVSFLPCRSSALTTRSDFGSQVGILLARNPSDP